MRKLLKLPFYFSKLLGQAFKSDRVPYHFKNALFKYQNQPNLTWRLVGNQTVKSKLNGKIVSEKARFFVSKPTVYSSEIVGKNLEKFKKYIESKGFKISFEFVKLALIGVAFNQGSNDLAIEALRDSFLQDTNDYKDCQKEINGKKLKDFPDSIVFTRLVENDFEEIYIKEDNELDENNENIVTEIKTQLNNDSPSKDAEEVEAGSETDYRIADNGILINFEKLIKSEQKEDRDDEEFNKRLMNLLLLYLTENNQQLKQIQQTQQQFDEYLSNVLDEKKEEKKEINEMDTKVVKSNDTLMVSNIVLDDTVSLKDENDRLKKELDEKVDEIADLKKQIQLLNTSKMSGNDDSTFVLEDEDSGDGGGEDTFRRPWHLRN